MILPSRRWFCHVDDDNYVNVRTLVKHLSQYPHTQDMYIGKPSLDRPIEATERLGDNKMVRRTLPEPQSDFTFFLCVCKILPGFVILTERFCVLLETRQLLVRYRRSRLLCEPRAGAEDEPVGQVSCPRTRTHKHGNNNNKM